VSNNILQKATRLLVFAFVAVTTVHASPSHGQDADIKKQLEGVDLEGVQQLRLSPNGELAAGLTKLYDNPGPMSGSFCLIKIWSVKKKQLVHKFRVPGAVYEAVFSPDSGTLVSADKTGNLGYTTKIRAWNLVDGSERQIGVFFGVSNKFCFSPDGNRLAAIQFPEYSWLNPLGEYAFKLNVWQVKKSGGLRINIPNALGDHRATFLFHKWDGNPESDERVQDILARVTPELRGFSPDGKQLICDFETDPRTFDSQTGRILQRPEICTVGLFKSMLMIAPQQVPSDVKSLTIEITPREKPIRLEQAADGWWRTGQDGKYGFRVDGKHFISREGDVEREEEILNLLGLKDDTSLADLSSLKHPLGVIKIERDETELKFRLVEVTDGTDAGETLQTGEVRWTRTVSRGTELPEITPEFVPTSTYAAMSLNMHAILKKVDLDDPLITKLRTLSNVESEFLGDPQIERMILLFPSQVKDDAHPASPSGVVMQFQSPISPKAYFDRMGLSKYYEFSQEDYQGRQIHVPRLSEGVRALRKPSDVWFFPEKDVVASGTRLVVEQMIDGESSKSDGKKLVSDLDPKAELHFVLANNGKIDARMLASVFGHFDPLPGRTLGQALRDAKRMEFLFNYAGEEPIQITIEMKDGASMDRLMEQIKGVLSVAPGMLDAIEKHEIPQEEAIQPPFRELIALGRVAVNKMKVKRDGTILRMTLGQVQGLEKLPQAYLTWSMIQAAMSGP